MRFQYLNFNRNLERCYQIQSEKHFSYVKSYKLSNTGGWVRFLSLFFSLKLIGKSKEKL